jgi:RNA polymerase sigma factor (TIGR02999 family)
MPDDISELLERWKGGDSAAGETVIARTYDELRRVARAYIRRERPGHLLQPTALLHEAYLRLLRTGPGPADSREAFFRLMAGEMRRRLVDHARRRMADKRGGGAAHQSLDELSSSEVPPAPAAGAQTDAAIQRLDEALRQLSASFPRAARVVELRFLAGLTTEEAAAALGLSSGTVKRDWAFARAWLASAVERVAPP